MWRIRYIGGPMDGETEESQVVGAEIRVAYAGAKRCALYVRETMDCFEAIKEGGVRFRYDGDRQADGKRLKKE